MKTTFKLMLLGAVLVFTACPSESKVDAGAPATTTATTNPNTPPAPAPAVPLTDEEKQKALYGFGAMIAERTPIKTAGLDESDLEEVMRGLKAAALNQEPEVKLEDYGPKVDQFLRAKQMEKVDAEKAKGAEFLAKQAKEKGAQKLPSGLVYLETQKGTGKQPAATDTVKVHYKGTLIDGTEFDSSYKRGQPTEFPLNGVIKCWTEGVAKMKAGGKAKLICPSDIAYGDRGAGPNIPGGSTLVFEVELIEVKDPAAKPAVPDLGVPPQGK